MSNLSSINQELLEYLKYGLGHFSSITVFNVAFYIYYFSSIGMYIICLYKNIEHTGLQHES
jgi:hypothetical protein